MAVLRVHLFRDFSIELDGAGLSGLENRKFKELLAFLLVYHARPHRREALMNLLWKDASAEKSRRNMRQLLWQLQHYFDFWFVDPAQRLLLVEGEWLRVNPQAAIWCDVSHFLAVYRRVQGQEWYELTHQLAQELRETVNLYRGGLLEGCYQDWCVIERENLQNVYMMMLDKLMDYCEAYGYLENGIAYGVQSLRHDPERERTYRRLMRLYALLDDRAGVMRLYKQCVAILQREYGVAPSERTQQLYRAIRHNELIPAGPARPRPVGGAALSTIDLSRLFVQVTRIAGELENARSRISTDLESISHFLMAGEQLS